MLEFESEYFHILYTILVGEFVFEFVILADSMEHLLIDYMGILPSFWLVKVLFLGFDLIRLVNNWRSFLRLFVYIYVDVGVGVVVFI